MNIYGAITLTAVTLFPLEMLNSYLKHGLGYYHPNHRWCLMHSVINLAVMVMTVRGTVALLSSDTYLRDLTESPDAGFNICSSILVMSAHIYHLMQFPVTDTALLAHHYIMMSVLVIPYFIVGNQLFMVFTDYSLFFLCGLPGMIDYYCMHLCYKGEMKRIREKRLNTLLNSYIRAPGILYGAFITYRMWVNSELSVYYAVPVILSFMWNAQYFSSAVSYSYGYSKCKQKYVEN